MSAMETTHHAVLMRSVNIKDVIVAVAHDAELSNQQYSQFGIDEARSLIQQACQRPAEGTMMHIVVRIERITLEAQHALLKILEEPPESTKFTFVVAKGVSLLPTLLSRFHQEIHEETGVEETDEFTSFLSARYEDRLASIEQAAKKKDVEWQQAIKNGLVVYIGSIDASKQHYVELEFVARNLLTRGASNKMLLEHAALHLPIASR
jgi:hypothetical protein